MKLDKNVIDMAVDKKFSDFSSAIKTVLHSKLAGTPEIQTYTADFDNIQQMKTSFAAINTGAQS